ncbi:anoctamin family protein [Aspergillus candidus]|uniref:Putative plasma membrane stress response protein n=1 Tax=Aspergillus candidus TaxID=41067 RepID=A0A2I2FII6_ASPCN|nr:putative plasma membrane stress response protein [Aspergillus candidus]PLB40448.1 putative plasma membrane stress response protein [Aspergillus candidus]
MNLFHSTSFALQNGELDNRGVDWVIHYNFDDLDSAQAVDEFRSLIHDLEAAHLRTRVRHGYGSSLLICVRVPRDHLGHMIHQSRIKDWLFGIAHDFPAGDEYTIADPETPAEALRSVYHAVSWHHHLGGAGIIPKHGRCKNVVAAFPLHDPSANAELLRKWSHALTLTAEDLDAIRALYGEKVAFYFAFIHCYSCFLIVPALGGILCWWYLGSYSVTFAILNCLWGLVFVEYWKIREADLSLRWNVKGVGVLKVNRVEYVWDKEVRDAVTGDMIKVFPGHKQFLRQLWLIPFATLASLVLGSLIVVSFALEVFISEVYTGPWKGYLEFLPTVLFSLSLPFLSGILTRTATRLTDYENYRTQDQYELAQTAKTFVMHFITAFLPTMLTAFVYVPFGKRIVPLIDLSWMGDVVLDPARLRIDASRLQKEVIYLSAMAQVLSFGEEVVLPYVKRVLWQKWRDYSAQRTVTRRHRSLSVQSDQLLVDPPDEADFLARIRNESEADDYSVHDETLEMCVQFGYLALFGVAWPLVPLGFLINNWLELRGDFFKLSLECRRPPPIRTDSIGPSLQGLEVLTWMGTLSTAAIVYLYRDGTPEVHLWSFLLTILAAEWAYLAARFAVRTGLGKIVTHPLRHEAAKRYAVRKTFLGSFVRRPDGSPKGKPRVRFQDSVSVYTSATDLPTQEESVLHDEQDDAPAEARFWSGPSNETAEAGVRLIKALCTSADGSKPQKKMGKDA